MYFLFLKKKCFFRCVPPVKFPEKAKTVTDSLGIAAAPMTTSPSNFDPGMTPRGRNGRLIVVMLHFFVLKSTMYILFYENMSAIYLGLFHTIHKKASRNNKNQIILICYTGMWFGLCVAFFFKTSNAWFAYTISTSNTKSSKYFLKKLERKKCSENCIHRDINDKPFWNWQSSFVQGVNRTTWQTVIIYLER